MQETGIQWTDVSANIIRYRDENGTDVWACVKCSDGCKFCYSEKLALRFHRGELFTVQNMRKVTPYFCEKTAGQLLRSRKLAGKRVFIGDMTDVFGEWVPFELIDKMFAVFALRPDVTFQILTKRAERMVEYFADLDRRRHECDPDEIEHEEFLIQNLFDNNEAGDSDDNDPIYHRSLDWLNTYNARNLGWPLPNVWLGTSVEDQKRADERIPHLLRCPAAVRFLSAEPLLGPIDLGWHFARYRSHVSGMRYTQAGAAGDHETLPGVDWVIVGGESGGGARPMDIQWARSIVEQCKAAGVACFVKQVGTVPVMDQTAWRVLSDNGPAPLLDHRGHGRMPPGTVRLHVGDSKGGDMDRWPSALDDLRIRQMPTAAGVPIGQ